METEPESQKILNIEFKARCADPEKIKRKLLSVHAEYVGLDEQTDTYFNVKVGRLKLREGTIERALIHYERNNVAGANNSNVLLHIFNPESSLKDVLTNALGIKAQVSKTREIWKKDIVKIHLDKVEGLGSFVEVEARDEHGSLGPEKLQEVCQSFITLFEIRQEDFIGESYSDLVLADIR